MTPAIEVSHLGGDRFELAVRGHRLQVDQPVEDGGEDTAPTPTELFVSGLASCVAFYARRYLDRHGLAAEGLAVEARYSMASRPARVGEISIEIAVPAGLPDDRRAALLAVAGRCTVHNTLLDPPAVRIDLRHARDAAA
jgi:putative redox protein